MIEWHLYGSIPHSGAPKVAKKKIEKGKTITLLKINILMICPVHGKRIKYNEITFPIIPYGRVLIS